MKTINTTVSTGDIVKLKDGRECRIGIIRKVDGKNLIDIHFKINDTSGYTEQVSTRKLNQILKS